MQRYLVKYLSVLLLIMPLGVEAITSAPVITWVGGSYQGKTPGEVISQHDASSNTVFQRCMDSRPTNGMPWSCAQISYSMSGSDGPIINGLPARVFYSCSKYEFGIGWDGQPISVSSTCTTLNVVKEVRCMSGGMVLSGNQYHCRLPENSPPDNCSSSGNPVNFLSGDKIESEIDFKGRGGLRLTRSYENQRIGWVVESSSRVLNFSSSSQLDDNNQRYCYGLQQVILLNNYDPASNSIERVTTYFCSAYVRDPAVSGEILLKTADGFIWSLAPTNGFYANSFFKGRLFALNPQENDGATWLLHYADGRKEYFDGDGLIKLSQNNSGDEISYLYEDDRLLKKANRFGDEINYEYAQGGMSITAHLPGGASVVYAYVNSHATGGARLLDSVTFSDGSSYRYEYNDSRFPFALTGAVDAKGIHFASWEYDAQGRAISSKHAGEVDHYKFDYSLGYRTTVTNPLGKKTTYIYNSINGRRVVTHVEGQASAHCLAANKQYRYYPTGQLESKTDWKGVKTVFSYNSIGQEISRTEAFGTPDARTITTEWHPDFYVKTRVVDGGKETLYTYDDNGRLLSTTTHPLPIQ
jgi:hypothetical protein